MNNNKALDFNQFQQANPHSIGNQLNYINFIYQALALPPDFIMAFQKFCSPDFILVDGLIYYADRFDKAKYNELQQQGKRPEEIQFWMNLILISGLFIHFSANDESFENVQDLPFESAQIFAKNLADSWNATITQKFGEQYAIAHYMYDEADQEIFITLGNPN